MLKASGANGSSLSAFRSALCEAIPQVDKTLGHSLFLVSFLSAESIASFSFCFKESR